MFDILFRIGTRRFQRWNRSFIEKHVYLPAALLVAGLGCLGIFALSQSETAEVVGWGLVVLSYPWLLLIGGLGLCLKASQAAHERDPSLPLCVGLKQLAALVPILAFLVYLANYAKLSPALVLAGLPLVPFAVGLAVIALAGIISALINGTRPPEPHRQYRYDDNEERYGSSRWDQ